MSCHVRLPIRVKPIDGGDTVFGVEGYYGHSSYAIEIVFSLIRFFLVYNSASFIFIVLAF
jgi:hypothetical protein